MVAATVEVALRALHRAVVVRYRALRHHQAGAHHRAQVIALVRAHRAAAHHRATVLVQVRRAAAVVRHHRALVVARVLRVAALARQVFADKTL